jgi:nicotinate-nucleotide adenylyltransferase
MIGIFGGTFDPIHYGHLRIALDIKEHLGLSEIRFVPLNNAVHRDQPQTSSAQRLAMVQVAIEGQPGFTLDERELKRTGSSFTVDTLTAIRSEMGDHPLCLLLGSDAFNGFLRWHRPMDILKQAHIMVMARPGEIYSDDPELQALLKERYSPEIAPLHQQPGGLIYFQTVTQLDISSTRIRKSVAHGESVSYLLPLKVEALIKQEGLYKNSVNSSKDEPTG